MAEAVRRKGDVLEHVLRINRAAFDEREWEVFKAPLQPILQLSEDQNLLQFQQQKLEDL